ncbi:cuticle protein AMP4-like [Homarus americanus]|uniref:cuticle protein AMP4-like n=1 Tax=Homarus americanus TaxID=6706 RepID=UPI001C486FB9|nr:cuticle protein AMP4-like [Homarus americanus]
MKAVIFAAVVALAAAAKLPGAPAPTPVPIIHQAQVNPELGTHNFEFESGNGIVIQESGSEGTLGGANRIGQFSYPQEDGTLAVVQFVADENGFQPQSSLLPVAPAFPHPIPQFVLDQIAFAEAEKERKAREGKPQ